MPPRESWMGIYSGSSDEEAAPAPRPAARSIAAVSVSAVSVSATAQMRAESKAQVSSKSEMPEDSRFNGMSKSCTAAALTTAAPTAAQPASGSSGLGVHEAAAPAAVSVHRSSVPVEAGRIRTTAIRRAPKVQKTKRDSVLGLLQPSSSDEEWPNSSYVGTASAVASAARPAVVSTLETRSPVGVRAVGKNVYINAALEAEEGAPLSNEASTAPKAAGKAKAQPVKPVSATLRDPLEEEFAVPSATVLKGPQAYVNFQGPGNSDQPKWSEGPLNLPDSVALPECIASYLRPYQRDGVRWLYERLFTNSEGCILADDMGLGKTVQVATCLCAAHFSRESPIDSTLVVCPPTLMQHWRRELQKWGPFVVEVAERGGQLHALQRLQAGMTHVLVVSRGLFSADSQASAAGLERICSHRWGCVVIDEAHEAKNPSSRLHTSLLQLSAGCKLGLTGTPIQNVLTDYWALLRLVDAHGGWSLAGFKTRFSKPIEHGQKRKATVRDLIVREDALDAFQTLFKKTCLRRTKDEVSLQLPGKNDRIVSCDLSDVQRTVYQNLLASPDWKLVLGERKLCVCGEGGQCICGTGPVWRYIHRKQADEKGLEDEYAAALECSCRGRAPPKCLSLPLTNMLMKVSNHLELIKPSMQPPRDSFEAAKQEFLAEVCQVAFAGISHHLCTVQQVSNRLQLGSPDACGKMRMLMPLLEMWNRKNEKALIFSRSTRLLDIVEACLFNQGWSPRVLRLDGGTPPAQRQRLVDEFQAAGSGKTIFLISTRAGGVGLNLVAASVVVIFDPDWNPCVDLQAQDRPFRIGQTKVVEVFRLLSSGTVEEQVYIRQVWKQTLSTAALDDVRTARRLDEDDVFGLKTLFTLHESSRLGTIMENAKREPNNDLVVEKAGGGNPQAKRHCKTAVADKVDVASGEKEVSARPSNVKEASAKPSSVKEVSDKPINVSKASEDVHPQETLTALELTATQELAGLDAMFNQLDHSRVLRDDTQEHALLEEIGDQQHQHSGDEGEQFEPTTIPGSGGEADEPVLPVSSASEIVQSKGFKRMR